MHFLRNKNRVVKAIKRDNECQMQAKGVGRIEKTIKQERLPNKASEAE